MTLWDILRALVRRWPVTLAGILVTGVAGLLVVRDPGVYWTQAEVQFLAPKSDVNPNPVRTTSEDIVITAGAVARKINGPGQVQKYGSADVTLIGLGVRDGWSVRLPDTGGQWATNFPRQVLIIEAVNPNREQARQQLAEKVTRVNVELDKLQNDLGVAPVDRITTKLSPDTPPIYWVGGSRSRALGMTTVLGAAATLAAVVNLERRRLRRSAV